MQYQFPYDSKTFSTELGEEAKQEGMELAALSRRDILELAREWCVEVAAWREDQTATADDAQEYLAKHGFSLGNAAGSLFMESHWKFTGKWVKSRRVSNHARMIRVWKLK